MKKTIVSILGIVILAAIGIAAEAQSVPRPLPRAIQNLSDEDYTVWAQWQNRQASRRGDEAGDTSWRKYDYATRVTSDSFSRGSASMQSRSTSKRNDSRTATRNGSTHATVNQRGGTTITSRKIRYLSPDYVGPRPLVVYNPWVRSKGSLGTPDWANLFVPCKEDTITMQEVLDLLIGPQNPERVFKTMMEGYLGN
jgi:hypothetical protein